MMPECPRLTDQPRTRTRPAAPLTHRCPWSASTFWAFIEAVSLHCSQRFHNAVNAINCIILDTLTRTLTHMHIYAHLCTQACPQICIQLLNLPRTNKITAQRVGFKISVRTHSIHILPCYCCCRCCH